MTIQADTLRHRAMILNPYAWPHMILPLKRTGSDGFMQIAVLVTAATEPEEKRLVQINMSLFGPLGEVEPKVYETVDEILEDGWRVD